MKNQQLNQTVTKNKKYKISIIELIKLLESNRHSIIVNNKKLRDSYQRQGIKRIKGIRDNSGNLIKPYLETRNIDSNQYLNINHFRINNNTATINMLMSNRVKLYNPEQQTSINEVAGLLLNNLDLYNNYTIVSEGKINISDLVVKINNQNVFKKIKRKGVLFQGNKPADKFDFHSEYIINLEGLPLLPENISYTSIQGLFTELATVKIISSILRACLKKVSDKLTSEQINELKKHYISSNIYVNFPTTTEYIDIETALATGNINTKQSCKINIGNKDILNFSQLYSANHFFQKRYEVLDRETGEIFTKPTLDMISRQNIICRHKSTSSRMKITRVDELMQQVFDDFLGLENHGIAINLLQKVGAFRLRRVLQAQQENKPIDEERLIKAMTEAKIKLNKYSKKLYQEKISPLVLYVGIRGVLPPEILGTMMTATELVSKYPHLQLSQDEQKGQFFEVGESIISMYFQTEYYSTSVS